MSRIGKLPIQIPSGVTITVDSDVINVEGPKGKLVVPHLSDVTVTVEDGNIIVTRKDDQRIAKAQHGLQRALLNNAVDGVTKAFEKKFASIFDRYKVDAYLCGHEHDLQVIQPKGRYTTQFLSGAACEIRPTGNREGTLFAASEPGFMAFSINDKKLQVQAINEKGKILYTTAINK